MKLRELEKRYKIKVTRPYAKSKKIILWGYWDENNKFINHDKWFDNVEELEAWIKKLELKK